MANLQQPRTGNGLVVKDRPLPFSFWPVYRTTRRFGVRNPRTFVSNPWLLIRRSIRNTLAHRPDQMASALAFTDQTEDFYRAAANANPLAAKPLLLYYSLMNLVKAFILTKNLRERLDEAYHGLEPVYGGVGNEFIQSSLRVHRSTATRTNLFDDFSTALSSPLPITVPHPAMNSLLPQDVLGNQLYSIATDEVQRFFKIEAIEFMDNASDKEIWMRIFIYRDERKMQGNISVERLLRQTRVVAQNRYCSVGV